MYELERPFDYPMVSRFTPTPPDPARGTLTRKMNLSVWPRLLAARDRNDRPAVARLCRINNYLHRRETRMRVAAGY